MKNFVVNELRCKCCGDLPENARMNCVSLVENVLDDARDKYGGPIKVNSFYRCSRNNTRCGGAKASQHLCLGNNAAADVCTGVKTQSMHVSYRKGGKNRKVVLKHVSGKAVCEELSRLDMEQLMSE